jgi:hypothetical protein
MHRLCIGANEGNTSLHAPFVVEKAAHTFIRLDMRYCSVLPTTISMAI